MKTTLRKLTPEWILNIYHFKLALLGAIWYGFPGKKIKVIGITGTSGKTTVVNMTTKTLEQAGHNVASLSSIKFKIKDKEWENKLKMTMPGRMKIQKFLKAAVKEKCDYAVLEVTSQGIKQYRHKFINFNTVVFTNLSPEHIESHKGFENYRNAKLKLFQDCKNIHIINLDDKNSEYFLKYQAKKKIGYTIDSNDSSFETIQAKDIQTQDNVSFKVEDVQFNLNLLGKFNIYNALASISIAKSQGISLDICKQALENVSGIPGRMETVIKSPRVVVDYAHTPVALEKVYRTLSRQGSRMICVLGSCGGGRDKWKRPILGEIASQYCQEIIVTDEDPYDENPEAIIDSVIQGTRGKGIKVLDRREAIKKSLQLARPDDTVVITGKGSEPWICLAKGKKLKWDDREIVKQEFNNLNRG
tara:strand:- start:174 stop:1421 length:1248 start_codon:yes stop_codon:yes gene_type:complete